MRKFGQRFVAAFLGSVSGCLAVWGGVSLYQTLRSTKETYKKPSPTVPPPPKTASTTEEEWPKVLGVPVFRWDQKHKVWRHTGFVECRGEFKKMVDVNRPFQITIEVTQEKEKVGSTWNVHSMRRY